MSSRPSRIVPLLPLPSTPEGIKATRKKSQKTSVNALELWGNFKEQEAIKASAHLPTRNYLSPYRFIPAVIEEKTPPKNHCSLSLPLPSALLTCRSKKIDYKDYFQWQQDILDKAMNHPNLHTNAKKEIEKRKKVILKEEEDYTANSINESPETPRVGFALPESDSEDKMIESYKKLVQEASVPKLERVKPLREQRKTVSQENLRNFKSPRPLSVDGSQTKLKFDLGDRTKSSATLSVKLKRTFTGHSPRRHYKKHHVKLRSVSLKLESEDEEATKNGEEDQTTFILSPKAPPDNFDALRRRGSISAPKRKKRTRSLTVSRSSVLEMDSADDGTGVTSAPEDGGHIERRPVIQIDAEEEIELEESNSE